MERQGKKESVMSELGIKLATGQGRPFSSEAQLMHSGGIYAAKRSIYVGLRVGLIYIYRKLLLYINMI